MASSTRSRASGPARHCRNCRCSDLCSRRVGLGPPYERPATHGVPMNYQFDFGPVLQQLGRFGEGAAMTLELSFAAIALGTLLGTLGAIAATYGRPWVQRAAACYVE